MRRSNIRFAPWLRAIGLTRGSDMLVLEQFRLVAKQIPVLYSVIIVNCSFMALLASGQVAPILAIAFPAAAAPIMVYRIFAWQRMAERLLGTEDYEGMRKALSITTKTANFMAMVLAAWSIIILLRIEPDHAGFIPVFTILSMITCAYCLSAYPAVAYSVMLSGSAYIALALAWTGDGTLVAMALNIGLVAIMVVYMTIHQHGQLRRLVRSTDRLKRQSRQARQLAYQDQLTGLPNRRALIARLRRLRPGAEAGVIMIDLNGFKPVNDTFGHAAGDEILITISRRLQDAVQDAGFVARLGGDEFCVLLLAVKEEEVIALARQIKIGINEPMLLHGHLLHLGVAIGVAVGSVSSGDPNGLLQRADLALYDAKALGGSSICAFETQMEARIRRRTLIEYALADHEQLSALKLQYQPIFTLRDNVLVAYEALARWDHPQLGRIGPSEFIDVAERTGKARQLTLHLFRQAILEARTWPGDLSLSFNLSGSGLCAAGFEASLPAIMDELDFPAKRLVLEVTETALLKDPIAAWAVLKKLKDRGVRITLDDFGAGHASVGYLRDIHLDGVKLDGSLVRNVSTCARSRSLLMGVLQLCRSIGAVVTAEQVETSDQLIALQAFPIDFVQGYYLGMPKSHDEADEADTLSLRQAG